MILIGNRVMIQRIETEDVQTSSGLILTDPFNRGEIQFEVLQVGPGRWLKHPKKDKSVFITPEVSPGDRVISRHWFTAPEHPSWHQPQYIDSQDGSGRIILDSRFCEAIIPKPQTHQFITKTHL